MTLLSNASENENAACRVQVWLNGIVEAFRDQSCEPPINYSPRSDGRYQYLLQSTIKLQYSQRSHRLHLGVIVLFGQIVLL